MNASELGSVVIGEEGAVGRGAEEPVVPNGSGKGEKALGDETSDTECGGPAMQFETELSLESVEDGLDGLADPAELAEAALFFFAQVGANQSCAAGADEGFEIAAGISLVGDDEQPGAELGVLKHGLCDLPIVDLGIGQTPERDSAIGSGEQVQAQAPEVAGVGGAIAIVGPAGELGALGSLARGATGDGSGIEQSELIPPRRCKAGPVAHGMLHQPVGSPQPLVVGRGLGQIGEQMAQASGCEAHPAALGVEAEENLGHGQADQFRVGEAGGAPRRLTKTQEAVEVGDLDVECPDAG